MKDIKIVILLLLLLITVFLGLGTVSAAPTITVSIEPNPVHVGDEVTIHVTIQNPDAVFYSNIQVLVPWPNGLKYKTHHGGGINNVNWNTTSGIWYPGNMRPESRGQQKNLWIIGTVKPELENKTIRITARYLQIYDQNVDVAPLLGSEVAATPDYLKVLSNSTNNGNGNGTGNGTGSGKGSGTGSGNGNGTGKENGNGIDSIDTLVGLSNENNPLLDLETGGGGGNGKAYEITNATNKSPEIPENTLYGILGALIIITLFAVGYFKRIREN